jgi:uncharacterized protein YdaU (DUF1376 family)
MSSNLLWFPFFIKAFDDDTDELSGEECGAYLMLLKRYYKFGPLPNDPARLCSIARWNARTWKGIWRAIEHYFHVGEDGLLHQKRADVELARAEDISAKRRSAVLSRPDRAKPTNGSTNEPTNEHPRRYNGSTNERKNSTNEPTKARNASTNEPLHSTKKENNISTLGEEMRARVEHGPNGGQGDGPFVGPEVADAMIASVAGSIRGIAYAKSAFHKHPAEAQIAAYDRAATKPHSAYLTGDHLRAARRIANIPDRPPARPRLVTT